MPYPQRAWGTSTEKSWISGCFQGFFREFQGVFRVFSGWFQAVSGCFQGVFRLFSGCFQAVFPYALSGYALETLPKYFLLRNCYWSNSGKGGSSNLQYFLTGLNGSQMDSSHFYCKKRKGWKLLETIIHSRQGLSSNKSCKFWETDSWKHFQDPLIFWLRQYTNNSEIALLCNRCACNWKIERILGVIGVHRKYLMEAPESHRRIPGRKPGVTDVLRNWQWALPNREKHVE